MNAVCVAPPLRSRVLYCTACMYRFGGMEHLSREELNKRAHVLAERSQLFTEGLVALTHPGFTSVRDEEAERELQGQCQELKTKIEQVKAECNRLPEVPTFEDKDSPTGLLLQEQKLRSELAVWQKQQANVLSTSCSVEEANTHHQLKENIEQLQSLLAVVRGQKAAARKKLEREKELLQETQQIEEALKKEAATLEEERSQESGSHDQELERKLAAAEETCRDLKEKLVKFVSDYILQPSEEEEGTNTRKRTRRGARQTTLDSMVRRQGGSSGEREIPGLPDVIEQLISKCLETPHEPYLPADSIWPPHFHLLLRSGILQRHPDNPTLVRITPFHH